MCFVSATEVCFSQCYSKSFFVGGRAGLGVGVEPGGSRETHGLCPGGRVRRAEQISQEGVRRGKCVQKSAS